MRMNTLPTQEFLLECFDYNPEIGILIWKHRPLHHFNNSDRYYKAWNKRWSGTIAGAVDSKGYYVSVIDKKMCRLHRVVWKIMTGEDSKLEIDHIDNNPKNNTWSNLREATRIENCRNVRKPKNNTSGLKGVSYYKNIDKYRAQIGIDGKSIHIGYFSTAEEAHEAYCEASKRLHKEFSNIN